MSTRTRKPINLSLFVLGFSVELVVERILPAMGVAILFGNIFYGWQARRLGLRLGRNDVTALPYGINLLPIFFFIFYVMLPAQQIALSAGLSKAEADVIAWKAGVIACIGSGLIEVFGSFFVHHIRKVAPRAALLSALAVIGIFFIGADYCFRAYAFPAIGIPTLLLTLYFYYGSVRLKWNLPGGLIILVVGVAIAWITYAMGLKSPISGLTGTGLQLGVYLPGAYGLSALGALGEMIAYAAIILPMGLINVVGSMQAIESAAAAGDDFAPRETLVVNGIGSLIAGGLGSPFPTTLYIGHLGMKQIGARAGYSVMNGVAMALPKLAPEDPVYVVPPIQVAKSNEHDGFPGTLILHRESVRQLTLSAGRQIAEWGFRRLVVLNTHGGNSSVVKSALRELALNERIECELLDCPYKADITEREKAFGIHANEIESSLMYAAVPQMVDPLAATCCWIGSLDDSRVLQAEFAPATYAWKTLDISSSGVMGDARKGSAEKGRLWAERAAEALADRLKELVR